MQPFFQSLHCCVNDVCLEKKKNTQQYWIKRTKPSWNGTFSPNAHALSFQHRGTSYVSAVCLIVSVDLWDLACQLGHKLKGHPRYLSLSIIYYTHILTHYRYYSIRSISYQQLPSFITTRNSYIRASVADSGVHCPVEYNNRDNIQTDMKMCSVCLLHDCSE